MKKQNIIVLFFILIGTTTYAQQASKGDLSEKDKKKLLTMKKELKLTPEQENKVTAALIEKKQKIKAAKKEYKAVLKSALSDDQYNRWRKLEDEND